MNSVKHTVGQIIFFTSVLAATALVSAGAASEYTVNKDAHTNYFNGTSETTFSPDTYLTRAETAQVVYSLLTEKPPVTKKFDDVGNQWYAQAVNSLYSAGIVSSRMQNNNFDPNLPISRAELADILYYFCKDDVQNPSCDFSDVPDTYYKYPAVAAASTKGWITGYPNKTFRPGDPLRRAETAAIFNRFLERYPDTTTIDNAEKMRVFTDVGDGFWAYYDIMEATVSHEYTKNGDAMEQWSTFSLPNTPLDGGLRMTNRYLYYVDPDAGYFVRNKAINGYTFGKDGRYTTSNETLDNQIHDILLQYCSDNATSEDNLRAVFNYVRDNFKYQARAHVEHGATGWDLQYAVPMMKTHYGNCYSWASVFTYLARSIGYEACSQSGLVNTSDHGWTEIMFDGEWRIFDPELEYSYHGKYSFYNIPHTNTFSKYTKY